MQLACNHVIEIHIHMYRYDRCIYDHAVAACRDYNYTQVEGHQFSIFINHSMTTYGLHAHALRLQCFHKTVSFPEFSSNALCSEAVS